MFFFTHAFCRKNKILTQKKGSILVRVRTRFFDQVGHETMDASSGIKHFSQNHDIVRLTEIMNKPSQTHQTSYFQSHFSVLKIGPIFPKKISMKNI